MNITLDASDFAQLADFWQRAPDITRTRIEQAMVVVDTQLQATLKQDLPRGAGGSAGLAGSIATEEHAFNDNVIGMVFSPEPYAAYIETGTRPHWAPIQPILDWVKVKFGLVDVAAKDRAYAIRGAIAKRGTKANPVWQNTWNNAQPSISETFSAAMQQIAADLAGSNA